MRFLNGTGSLPLAWAVWEQNQPLPDGYYWQTVDTILARIAALVPAGLEVSVVADRAYNIPAFVDRSAGDGWHWVVRCKAGSSLRWRDSQGREGNCAPWWRATCPVPGGAGRRAGRSSRRPAGGWRVWWGCGRPATRSPWWC